MDVDRGVVAVDAGIEAHGISLGIDSLIELAAAGLLIWRLSVELKQGRACSEDAERTARAPVDAPVLDISSVFAALGVLTFAGVGK